jgi:hypothetical protein
MQVHHLANPRGKKTVATQYAVEAKALRGELKAFAEAGPASRQCCAQAARWVRVQRC